MVKNRKIILSVFSAFIAVIFLAGSTGINILIHNCTTCSDNPVNSSIYLTPSVPEDGCCEDTHCCIADTHCSHTANTDRAGSFEAGSCLFKIEKLKLTNYTPSVPLKITEPPDAQYNFNIDNFKTALSAVSFIRPLSLYNKHGSRSVISLNCQYLI